MKQSKKIKYLRKQVKTYYIQPEVGEYVDDGEELYDGEEMSSRPPSTGRSA